MKKLTLNDVNENQIVIDLRTAELFAIKHYPGAINVPFGGSLVGWVKSAVPDNASLILIGTQEMAEASVDHLQFYGFSVIGYVPEELLENHPKNESLKTISVTELAAGKHYIVDVRTSQEWEAGHIKGAQHLELSKFKQTIDQIPKDREIALICGGGNRSSVAASVLKKNGYPHVVNVRGGMSAWKQAGLDVSKHPY